MKGIQNVKKNDEKIKKNIGFLEITLSILIMALAMYLVYTHSSQIRSLGNMGYMGATLIAFLSSATVFIPGPGLFIVGSLANIFNPVLLAIFAGVGAGFGEFTGYLSGEGLRKSIYKPKVKYYRDLIKEYGPIIIFIFASFPNPLFDIIGIASGLLKIPRKTFLIAVIAGNILKYLLVCYLINLMGIPFGLGS